MSDSEVNQPNPQPLSGLHVLLVEDEVDVADLVVYILNESGADVTWALSAVEALSILETQQPDILVSNLKLPSHDGCWLVEQIRKSQECWKRSLPAIAVTSYTREIVNTTVLTAGFHRFLPKPLNPDELVDEVLMLTGRKK